MIRIKNKILILNLFLIICIIFTSCIDRSLKGNNELIVHYIDVGQADSILIQTPKGKNMLIDAGETKNGAIKAYLDSLGIKNIDFVIETHPHEDHISEMSDIIKTYNIGNVYMPKVMHTTKSFEKMLDEIEAKGLQINEAKVGISINIEDGISCDIVAPCSDDYENLNNWSTVLHLTYGQTSFLFTGDAEKLSEDEILESNANIKADVLKVGHHGSSTSTSENFLNKVNPKYAVISLAKQNDYGHPHKETIKKFEDRNIQIYQTCDSGTIKAISNGKEITIIEAASNNTSKSSKKKTKKLSYIGNKNSKKFHTNKCDNLPSKKNRINFKSRNEAIKQGYSPCKTCNP